MERTILARWESPMPTILRRFLPLLALAIVLTPALAQARAGGGWAAM